MKKIIVIIILALSILTVIAFLIVKYGLVNDHRETLANDLFQNDHGVFDYAFLEQRLNTKFGAIDKRKELVPFILRNDGECTGNICKLPIYSTICLSKMAIIEISGESNIVVEPFVEGC